MFGLLNKETPKPQGLSLQMAVSKLDTYDNTEPTKLHYWFKQFEVMIKSSGFTDQDCYKSLGMVLKGKALEIFYELQQSNQCNANMSFPDIKALLFQKFIPHGSSQKAMTDFFAKMMGPNETVDQYKDKLEELGTYAFVNCPSEVKQVQFMNKLQSGLLPPIAEYVTQSNPSNLQELLQRAREKEGFMKRSRNPVTPEKPQIFAQGTAFYNNNRRSGGNDYYANQQNQFQRRDRFCNRCQMNNHSSKDCWYKNELQHQNQDRIAQRLASQHAPQVTQPILHKRKAKGNRNKPNNYAAAANEDIDTTERSALYVDTDDSNDESETNAFVYLVQGCPESNKRIKRVEVAAKVEHMAVDAMIDSGASLCICSSKFFKSLVSPELELRPSSRSLTSLTGTNINVVGKTVLKIQIGPLQRFHQFLVVDNSPIKLLIGNDYLQKYNSVIDYRQSSFTVQNYQVPFKKNDQSDEVDTICFLDVKLGPNSINYARANIPAQFGTDKLIVDSYCFTCNKNKPEPDCINHQHAYIPESVIQSNESNEVKVPVCNRKSISICISQTENIHVERLPENAYHLSTKSMEETKQPLKLPELIKGLKFDTLMKHATVIQRNNLVHLIAQYADCFIFDDSQLGCSTNVIEHKIETGSGKPISLPPRRLPYQQREFVYQYIRDLLDKGIIVPSNSEWASPIVLAPKADGTIRFCVDYIEVNKITRPDQYPMPHNDDLFDSIGIAIIFSKLDLCSGFWQIQMYPPHRSKTAFRTLAGLYEFVVMPFGLRNAPATFQRMMENVLRPYLFKCSVVLIDDVLIYSPSFDQHIDHDLPNILNCLRKANLKAKVKKYELCVPEVEYLGHMLGHRTIRPMQKKVKAISEMPTPKNTSEVRQLLGLVNYYRRYIPNLATITSPLNDLLRKDTPFSIDTKCEKAIQEIKDVLTSKPVMTLPDFSKEFTVYTDASIKGLGAILSQLHDDCEKVVAYASRSLKDPEKKYGATELEALAVIWGIKYFKHYLHGTHFSIVADHQALKWLMKSKQTNPRLGRWAIELQAYDYDIVYRKGKLNTNADCLSRLPIEDIFAAITEFPSLAQLKRAQRTDKEVSQIIKYKENDEEPRDKNLITHLKVEGSNYSIENGILIHMFMQLSARKQRSSALSQIVVPEDLRKTVLQTFHDDSFSGHLGFHKTYAKVRTSYYWRRMYVDIRQYCEACVTCNLTKPVSKHRREELYPLELSNYPFERMACDFIGPLPLTENKNKYILVFTDYHTRYCEAVPTKDMTAETTASVFLQRIISRHSAPAELLSDRGANFLSEVVRNVCKVFNTRKSFSTSYHPQTDGLTERFNKTPASMLKAYVSNNQRDWDLYIPYVLYAYNTSVQDSTLQTPFFLLYGRDPVHPNSILFKFQQDRQNLPQWLQQMRSAWELAMENTKLAQQRQKRNYDRRATQLHYQVGDRVFIDDSVVKKGCARKLSKMRKGPFRLVEKTGPTTFKVEHLNGSKPAFHDNINVNRMKASHQFP